MVLRSYKVGDTVVIENLAIKVDKADGIQQALKRKIWRQYLNIPYNYTYQPYEVKSEDMVLNYEGKDENV